MRETTHEIQPEEVMAYLDGEVSAACAGEIAGHVNACPECRAVASGLRHVSERLSEWSVDSPGENFNRRVNAAIERTGQSRERSGDFWRGGRARARRRIWQIAGGLTAAAVLFFAITTYFQSRENRLASLTRSTGLSTFESASPSSPAVAQNAVPLIPDVPLIARTASVGLVASDFERARAAIEEISSARGGFVAAMEISRQSDVGRKLDATVRVDARQLEAALSDLRALGRVTEESAKAEDVTAQHRDLVARLNNARETEKRLLDILRTRAGSVKDILEVEEQISSTRGEIEQMEAEQKGLESRVSYASIEVQVREEELPSGAAAPLRAWPRLRHAMGDGWHTLSESVVGFLEFSFNYGPSLLLWGFILFWPARIAWRKWQSRQASMI